MTNVDRSTVPGRVADARRGGTVTFVSGGAAERVEWARLHEDARAVAAALQARGVGPGAHVALLALTSRALVTAIQATWLAGATAVVLPLPMRMGSLGEFVAQTRARIAGADAALVAIGDELAAMLDRQEGDPPVVVLGQLLAEAAALGAGRFDPPAIDPESLAVLQFTSGSTAEPKGVMLPHRTILANLDGATEAAALDPESDVLVSWLPLYHDMGLIGLLTLAMITGTDLVLGAPHDFLSSPGSWMEWISRFGGTATAGPNFAYALATRALRRQGGLDLSRLRVALSGAEPVDPRTFAAFCEAAGAHGFDPRAAFPAFGMAEVAIAGTFPPLLSGLRTDTIEIDGQGRTFALLGRPIPGLEMRVVDPSTGAARGAREVGELEFAGTSVTSGYYRRPDATRAAFRGAWLRTGDLAYITGGELVICGRIKDLIIVGGRNIFPEDVERAAMTVPGIRAGNVVAFGVEGRRGKEQLVVVAETKQAATGALRDEVVRRVTDAVGVPPDDIVLVGAGTLPKTSSGKLQRSLCRARYLDAALVAV